MTHSTSSVQATTGSEQVMADSAQAENTFNITVGEFKGSLEMLLELVQKRKLNISEISLAQVADDYMSYVRKIDGVQSTQTASFIVVAATLLLIKSKSLLPNLDLDQDEEDDIKELEERLQLYSIYKEAQDTLVEHLKYANTLHTPKSIKIERYTFAPASNLTLGALSEVAQEVLKQLPSTESKPKAEIEEPVNIEDVMQNLLKRVESAVQSSFNSLSKTGDKQAVLINFLALLELVKDGVLLAEQQDTYGDILIGK